MNPRRLSFPKFHDAAALLPFFQSNTKPRVLSGLSFLWTMTCQFQNQRCLCNCPALHHNLATSHGLLRILLIAAFSFVCGIVFASFLNTKQALEKQNNLLREQLASSEEKSQARLQQLELCVSGAHSRRDFHIVAGHTNGIYR